jgi:hypothetical protein
MAGRGPAPKPEAERRRRNAPSKPKTTVAATPAKKTVAKKTAAVKHPQMRGPALPAGHSAKTKVWYDTWRRSPQAAAFEESDWQRLQMLAHLVEAFFSKVTNAQVQKQLLGEIRLNESSLGATVADRLRMNLEIKRDDPATPDKPAATPAKKAAAARKDRLLKVVGGTEA